MTKTLEMHRNDVRYVVQRTPRDIRDLLTKYDRQLYMGGGFIRATIAGEVPSDIDLFGDDPDRLRLIAKELVELRPGSRMHMTKNAITVIHPERLPVQFITRWTFLSPLDCIRSFDFTVCQAAIWREGGNTNDRWGAHVGEGFYRDLAGRRLVYTNPVREEEAGGSMLRAIKYVKRGYTIQVTSLAEVMLRCFKALQEMPELYERHDVDNLTSLLREVDPLTMIDGFEVVDEHKDLEGETHDT